MTPHEKAINAINTRLERLQTNLREAKGEAAQRVVFQAIVVTLGIAEALNDYLRMVGEHARRRHGELKEANDALAARHAGLLQSGRELLEKLRADPTDSALRKEIERTQRDMAAVQKTLRRGANTLQRDVAPSVALIDPLTESIRRLADADGTEALKRVLKAIIGHARELYADHHALPARHLIDAVAWESSALAEIDHSAGPHDAYARAGYQTILALELMTLAVSEAPPHTAEEATRRATDALAARLKEITGRFATT